MKISTSQPGSKQDIALSLTPKLEETCSRSSSSLSKMQTHSPLIFPVKDAVPNLTIIFLTSKIIVNFTNSMIEYKQHLKFCIENNDILNELILKEDVLF